MRNNIFFIRLKTQFENLGDALINRELISLCNNKGTVHVCISNVPESFLKLIDLPSYNKVVILRNYPLYLLYFVIYYFRKFTSGTRIYVVLNPGGYIGEITSKVKFFRYIKALGLKIQRILGFRTILIGASYEALGDKNIDSLKMITSELAEHIVRDPETFNYCNKLGAKVTGLMPDLAFNLRFEGSPGRAVPSVCLLSLRNMFDKNFENSLLAMLKHEFNNKKFEIIELCYQVQRDRIYLAELLERIKDLDIPVVQEVTDASFSIDSNIRKFATAKYVVSNRLHVLLLAMRSGTVPIPVLLKNNNIKIRGVLNDLKFVKATVIDLDEENIKSLFDFYDIDPMKYKLAFDIKRKELQEGFTNLIEKNHVDY